MIMPRQKFPDIPSQPGCYIFRDSKGRIIYIGKAKVLKKRVSSYFQKNPHDPKTEALLEHISSVDFIVTDNETEALLLENNLIKKHKPRYNIDLKDSKRYAFIQLTDEPYPRLVIARKRGRKGRFYGPFVSATERNHVTDLLIRSFKIRTCRKMPKRPCIRYHLGLCRAPCVGRITEQEYNDQIEKIKKVLGGKRGKLISGLKEEMKAASASQRYEKAAQLRDEIVALESLSEQQKVERGKRFDEDIINYMEKDGTIYLNLFNIYKGTLLNRQEFTFDYREDFLDEFIKRFYAENRIPNEIIIPRKIDSGIAGYLSRLKKGKVRIIIPKKGERKKLLSLVKKNIEISLFGDTSKLEELKKVLKLTQLPRVIECFDISHLGGTSAVGSMVQFRSARPDKSNYRRFRLRMPEKIDDFAAIAEVVRRRYSRLKDEKSEMPDLIIIDGGKGQLSAASNELRKLGLVIPAISIAKRLEEIFFPGSRFPLRLSKKEKALRLIQEIRDEAHRFAIAYNRLLRKKSMTS